MSSSSVRTQASNPQEQKSLSCPLRPSRDWQNLLDIFGDVMMMVGLDKLENIPKCRQVCQGWNVMVSQMTKLKKDTTRRRAEALVAKIRERSINCRDQKEIVIAASLAHHGMLGSVSWLILYDVDLASVPAEHLASLTSCVTSYLFISNVSNCDLISILDNLQSNKLWIDSQSLSTEETQALVRAMETGVGSVWLGYKGEVNLDVKSLTQYSGQGKCWCLSYLGNTAKRYREELRTYAQKISWSVDDKTDRENGVPLFDISKKWGGNL